MSPATGADGGRVWAPGPERPVGLRLMVTGGGAVVVDGTELAALGARLLRAAELAETATEQARGVSTLNYFVPLAPSAGALVARLAAVLNGPLSLPALGERIRALAADLAVQRQWYEEAEERAVRGFRPPLWRYAVHLLGPPKVRGLVTGLDAAAVLGHGGAARSRMGDPRLLDAVVAQQHARSLAGRMQWARPESVMGGLFLGREWVDVRRMTPVERTALSLVGTHEQASWVARGGRVRSGVTVATAVGRPVAAPPVTPGQALARIAGLEARIRARGTGAVEILRTTTPSGARHWTVVVPGTQEQWGGGRNPMDNGTNLRAMAGVGSDMEVGVTAAMRQAGIAPGEPVALAVHSQGGLVAARLVADPVFRSRFQVTTVLTAGSPIAGIALPPTVDVLSLEDVNDPTVGLDGAANVPAAHHVTVAVSSGEPARLGEPHQAARYAAAADLLAELDDDGVQAWLGRNRAAMGTAVPGARTDSFVFEISR
ncbi:hypothetical protein [Georgenia thermotolerans]|uniref:Alpha/beta hydrolase n=1 Tax=Georgenia thermotolerans TaxID=527326 RepID=A0A7J5UK28_9MICO|nr:hypothetical protein [Georgenia thermotolerans]KAE8762765.1 hypothetical protein GB883_17685 [Georgenia thermotolerans]